MKRFFLAFIIVLGLIFGCTWIWIVKKPMAYLAFDYGVWRLKLEMARTLPPHSVVIMGDSKALADFIPARIAPDVLNLALGGGTSPDMYVQAHRMLASPHPPRAVVLSLSPFHCMFTDSYWNHSVKYGYLDYRMMEDIRKQPRNPDDREDWNGSYADRTSLFGPPNFGDMEARFKNAMYAIRFPPFYFSSLIAGGVFRRGPHNLEFAREVREDRGHQLYGNAAGSKGLCQETQLPAFKPSPLFNTYLLKTIAQFQERNIPVYFVVTPFNEVSVAELRPSFADDYVRYIKSLELRYPNFHAIGDSFPAYPWIEFNDPAHLNLQGAQRFSDGTASLLRKLKIEN